MHAHPCDISGLSMNHWSTQAERALPEAGWFLPDVALRSDRSFIDTEGNDDLIRITTKDVTLDQRLGGGLETGWVTEIVVGTGAEVEMQGPYESPTAIRYPARYIGHTISVACQLPVVLGGAEGKMCYIDAAGTNFDASRIRQLSKSPFELHEGDVLSNIVYWPALPTTSQQQEIAQASMWGFATAGEQESAVARAPGMKGLVGKRSDIVASLVRLIKYVGSELLPYSRYRAISPPRQHEPHTTSSITTPSLSQGMRFCWLTCAAWLSSLASQSAQPSSRCSDE